MNVRMILNAVPKPWTPIPANLYLTVEWQCIGFPDNKDYRDAIDIQGRTNWKRTWKIKCKLGFHRV